jgi:serine protease AprX
VGRATAGRRSSPGRRCATTRFAALTAAGLTAGVCAGVLPGTAGTLTPLAGGAPSVDVLVSATGPASTAAEQAVARLGGRLGRRLAVIDGFAARMPAPNVARLRAEPGVRWVAPNVRLQVQGLYGQGSGEASAVYPAAVRARRVWGSGDTGAGVRVAVIDTGVSTAGDLAGQVVHATDLTNEQDNQDGYGHGTFVAGLIAGTGAASGGAVTGIAPGAGLVSLKIAGRDGSTDLLRVLAALDWVRSFHAAYGIRVLNLSLGVPALPSYQGNPLDYAVERVWRSGVVVVTAAGNNGPGTGTVTSPGDDPYVVTVGASDDHTTTDVGDDTLAPFAGSGPTADGQVKPDVLAPGTSVVSSRSPGSTVDVTYPGSEVGDAYAKGSGTSFATAVVSGVAALVVASAPDLTPDQVKQRLVSTARPLGTGDSPATGRGVVNAYAATTSTDSTPANQGVVPAQPGDGTPGDPSTDGSQWAGSQWVSAEWAG